MSAREGATFRQTALLAIQRWRCDAIDDATLLAFLRLLRDADDGKVKRIPAGITPPGGLAFLAGDGEIASDVG